MIWMFLFTIALLVYQSACKSFDPKRRGYVEAIWPQGHRNFKCPIGSYVKSFDVEKRKVYCEQHDKTIPDKRGYRHCEWQTRCYQNRTLRKGSDKIYGISRGLGFRPRKPSTASPKIMMFCCRGNCTRFQCKNYEKEGPMVDFRAKNNRFLNFAVWKKRQNVIKGEFCRPTCPVAGSPGQETDRPGPDKDSVDSTQPPSYVQRAKRSDPGSPGEDPAHPGTDKESVNSLQPPIKRAEGSDPGSPGKDPAHPGTDKESVNSPQPPAHINKAFGPANLNEVLRQGIAEPIRLAPPVDDWNQRFR